jgi:hypothetical protein
MTSTERGVSACAACWCTGQTILHRSPMFR